MKRINTIVSVRPDLLEFWDYSKNELDPEKTLTGSGREAWWVCSACEVSYRKRVRQRVKWKISKCTKCRSVAVKYEHLMEEWDYTKNKDDPYKTCSGHYWWVCKKCGYSWKSSITNRVKTAQQRGCPACAGQAVSDRNNLLILFPEVAKEWSDDNTKGPEEYTAKSGAKVWWKCSKCRHKWKSTIYNRTNGKGCPVCAGVKITKDNNFAVLRPKLLETWNYTKNKKIDPYSISPNSRKKVWWLCSECSHEWQSTVDNRSRGRNCPSCSNRTVTGSNNLSVTRPDLCKEWDYDKNTISPDEIVPGHNGRVWWLCDECGNSWEAVVNSRAYSGKGCPKCKGGPVSGISQEWLKEHSVNKEYREYYISELNIRVDGYDPKTNTIYEFLGNYWHGNPDMYDSNDTNEVVNKTFGTLYKEWLNRKELILESGYNLIYIWEKNFLERR